jgi:hypothetical protein
MFVPVSELSAITVEETWLAGQSLKTSGSERSA